jgi:drug/metabolite transporter (DMT)-like permease
VLTLHPTALKTYSREKAVAIHLKFEAANSAPVPSGSLWDTAELIAMVENHLQANPATAVRKRTGTGPAYLALAAGIVCIAWSAIFVRWTDIPGPASAFYRMLLPALVLLPTHFLDSQRSSLDRGTLWMIALGGLFFALDLALYNTSILMTTAANATLLGNNTPIVVGLLTWLVFRRRPPASFWVGLLMAFCGTAVILGADLRKHTEFGIGDLMSLGAAACFAVYLLVTERIRATTGTLAFLRWAMISSTVALLAINLILGVPLGLPHGRTLWAVLGLGLVSQLGGYLALTYALGHLPATITSLSLLSQGPLTALMAALLLGEPLTFPQIAGGVLVLAGVGLAHRQRHPEDEANV